MTEITGLQIRMARAGLRWTAATLAKRAKVSVPTVKRIEGREPITGGPAETLAHRQSERGKTLARIEAALVKAGVSFVPHDGTGVAVRVACPAPIER